MNVPFFNYKDYCKDIDYEKILREVLKTGYLIGGPFVEELEQAIVNFTGIKYCTTVANATDALEIIFSYLNLKKGSRVLVPSHTMLATASAAKASGLEPFPVDVNPDSLMLEIENLNKVNLDNVSACMVTQLNGVVADTEPIKRFCEINKLALVEDSAQGIGSYNKDKHAGSWGIGGCISFYPAKVIGCLGDGGAIITNNSDLYSFAKSVKDHGRGEMFDAIHWGRNSRLDSLNAKLILERLKNIELIIAKRRKLAEIYDQGLLNLVKKEFIKLPPKFSTNSSSLSTYQNYEVQAKYRDELMEFLKENNIGTIKQWGGFSIPHFKKLGFNIKDYPLTENLFNKLLLLPLNHLISENDVEYVITMVNNFIKDSNGFY